MKGKRHTTEDKIRILRAADGGKNTAPAYARWATARQPSQSGS